MICVYLRLTSQTHMVTKIIIISSQYEVINFKTIVRGKPGRESKMNEMKEDYINYD